MPRTDAEESGESEPARGNIFTPATALIRDVLRPLQEAGRAVTQSAQRRLLLDGLDHIRALKNALKPMELLPLLQVATAVEMLLKQLTDKAENINSSTLRTATNGVGVLEELCQPGLKPDLLMEPPLRLLVVDDETFSRYALAHALKRGLCEPDVAESGEQAMKLASRRTYDLILLDVQLAGMDGFELCSKIHETAANRATSVVFVTSLRDFDARANSVICGGLDLIAKPFLTFELTVKSLTLVAAERAPGPRSRPPVAWTPWTMRRSRKLPRRRLNRKSRRRLRPCPTPVAVEAPVSAATSGWNSTALGSGPQRPRTPSPDDCTLSSPLARTAVRRRFSRKPGPRWMCGGTWWTSSRTPPNRPFARR